MLKPSYFGYYNRYFISLQVYNRYQQSFLFLSGLTSLPSYTRNICPRTLNYLYLYAAQIYGHVPVHARKHRIIMSFTATQITGTFPYMPENAELSVPLLPEPPAFFSQSHRSALSARAPCLLRCCFRLIIYFLYLICYFISFISFVASE